MSNDYQNITQLQNTIFFFNNSLIDFYPELKQLENNDTEDQSPKRKNHLPSRKDSVRMRNRFSVVNNFNDRSPRNSSPTKNFVFKEEYELNDNFFIELFKKPCHLDKDRITKTISSFIRKSQLIKKLENEFESENNNFDFSQLSDICAQHLSYVFLERGKVLFKIDDLGDRFYFIIKGKVGILKPKLFSNIKMYFEEYLHYLMILIKQEENFIFNEVVHMNFKELPLISVDEIIHVNKITFMLTLKRKLHSEKITDNNMLKHFFNEYNQEYSEYKITKNDLNILEQRKFKYNNGEWENYIIDRCTPTSSDLYFFQNYIKYYEKDEKFNLNIYIYESILSLGPGFFFGDFALEKTVNKRSATIRAEVDSVLGWLKSSDYESIIAPKRKMEKMKEINFLLKKFFFKNINNVIFEKNFFHFFTAFDYNRNKILYELKEEPKDLIFLKKGIVTTTMKTSLTGIQEYIENLCMKLVSYSNGILVKNKIIPKEKLNELNEYLNCPMLKKLKMQDTEFVNEVTKIKKFNLTIYTDSELIGLEEIFLGINYISQCKVTCPKMTGYKLSIENLNNFLLKEDISKLFTKCAVNKVLSLIERLQFIKKTNMDLYENKIEKENIYRIFSANKTTTNHTKKIPRKNSVCFLNKDKNYQSLKIFTPDFKNNSKKIKNIQINNDCFQNLFITMQNKYKCNNSEICNNSYINNSNNNSINNSINTFKNNINTSLQSEKTRNIENKLDSFECINKTSTEDEDKKKKKNRLIIENEEDNKNLSLKTKEKIKSLKFIKNKNSKNEDGLYLGNKYYTFIKLKKILSDLNSWTLSDQKLLYLNNKTENIDNQNIKSKKIKTKNIATSTEEITELFPSIKKEINCRLNIVPLYDNFKDNYPPNEKKINNNIKTPINNTNKLILKNVLKYGECSSVKNQRQLSYEDFEKHCTNFKNIFNYVNYEKQKNPNKKFRMLFNKNKNVITKNLLKCLSSGDLKTEFWNKQKMLFIPKIVKDFYQEKKNKGASCFLRNKEVNTAFTIKFFHHKYLNKKKRGLNLNNKKSIDLKINNEIETTNENKLPKIKEL